MGQEVYKYGDRLLKEADKRRKKAPSPAGEREIQLESRALIPWSGPKWRYVFLSANPMSKPSYNTCILIFKQLGTRLRSSISRIQNPPVLRK